MMFSLLFSTFQDDDFNWWFNHYYYSQQMNYIQRVWLVALRPGTGFVNEKIAKKSGVLVRFGRFYAFGPR
jgi:hypothetical protein